VDRDKQGRHISEVLHVADDCLQQGDSHQTRNPRLEESLATLRAPEKQGDRGEGCNDGTAVDARHLMDGEAEPDGVFVAGMRTGCGHDGARHHRRQTENGGRNDESHRQRNATRGRSVVFVSQPVQNKRIRKQDHRDEEVRHVRPRIQPRQNDDASDHDLCKDPDDETNCEIREGATALSQTDAGEHGEDHTCCHHSGEETVHLFDGPVARGHVDEALFGTTRPVGTPES